MTDITNTSCQLLTAHCNSHTPKVLEVSLRSGRLSPTGAPQGYFLRGATGEIFKELAPSRWRISPALIYIRC